MNYKNQNWITILKKVSQFKFFGLFSEWDCLKIAVNFASVLILPINGPCMLKNVLLVPALTAQLLPAAVVTGDGDQAKPWCTCLVLSCINSHCSVPEYMCWHRDTHCSYLHIFRSERTPVIPDPQFCQDHPAHLTQSAELSTRMWFQWVCQHPASAWSSPSLRGHGAVHCWGFHLLGMGRRCHLFCPSAFPHCSVGNFRAGSVQNQITDLF